MNRKTARYKAAHTRRFEWQQFAAVWLHNHAVVYEAVAVVQSRPFDFWDFVIDDGRRIDTEPRHVYPTRDEALAARVAWAGDDEKRQALAARPPVLLRDDVRESWERERRLAAWRLSHGGNQSDASA